MPRYKFPKGNQINKGKHRSPATEFKKGHKPTHGFKKGHIPWCKGKKFPEYSGENSPTWKGGITKRAGYVFIRKPDHPFCNALGYVRESRLIVEQQIGRYLKPMEVTHHFNKIRHDNRPKNLMAFNSHSAHYRFHKNPENVKFKEIIFDGRKLIFFLT